MNSYLCYHYDDNSYIFSSNIGKPFPWNLMSSLNTTYTQNMWIFESDAIEENNASIIGLFAIQM